MQSASPSELTKFCLDIINGELLIAMLINGKYDALLHHLSRTNLQLKLRYYPAMAHFARKNCTFYGIQHYNPTLSHNKNFSNRYISGALTDV